MKLAFLAGGSVRDRRAWSGTTYYVHRALSQRFDVQTIELPRLSKAMRGMRKALRPAGLDLTREPVCSDLIGRYLAPAIQQTGAEAVFVLGASHLAAGLTSRFPVFHCSDATFAAMIDYHGEFTQLSRRTLKAGNALEGAVVRNSAAAIVSSDWAANSIRTDYGRSDGVHVVPFGANLDSLPVRDTWQRSPECSLLFIGVNWYEKGADVAVDTARLLNERGIKATLNIVGVTPPPEVAPAPYIKHHGFLRKQNPEEYARLTKLIEQADFLIVPTRFEAYGIVFCEAAAHGTPAISRRTGGVPTIIQDDITGALMAPDAGADLYAGRIQAIWSDEARYAEMRVRAFARAHAVLNWNAWGATVEAIVHDALGRRSPVARSA